MVALLETTLINSQTTQVFMQKLYGSIALARKIFDCSSSQRVIFLFHSKLSLMNPGPSKSYELKWQTTVWHTILVTIITCSGNFFKIFSLSASSTKCGICSNANSGAKLAEAADSCESLQTSAHWSVESIWRLYRGRWRPPETRSVPLAEPGTTPRGRPSSRTWEKPASSLKFQILKSRWMGIEYLWGEINP